MAKTEIGALAFTIHRKRIRLVLITTRRNKKWICPKGQPEKDLSDADLAALEAYEEAGVTGSVIEDLSADYVTETGKHIRLYPLRVKKILRHWPEKRQRRRIVVSRKQAMALVSEKGLRKCIRGLVKELRHLRVRH